MRNKVVIGMLFVLSLFAFGCSRTEDRTETVPMGTAKSGQMEDGDREGEDGEDSLPQEEQKKYYRMSYTRSFVDISEAMYAILTEEAEIAAFEASETKEEAYPYPNDAHTRLMGTMTVNGYDYRWEEDLRDGYFSYSVDMEYETTTQETAEELAREFLDRLGWSHSDELETTIWGEDYIQVKCRLCYDGVVCMGENTIFFEPDNEDELGATGFYISMRVTGSRIYGVSINPVPQIEEILETYDPEEDFLSQEEIRDMAKLFLESDESRLERLDLDPDHLNMEMEIIYMPYRDAARGNIDVLIPAYEVWVKAGPDSTFGEYMILYMDAVTGYICDREFE